MLILLSSLVVSYSEVNTKQCISFDDDDLSSSVFQDNSGNSNNVTIYNGAITGVTGMKGEALSLDGVNDYANAGDLSDETIHTIGFALYRYSAETYNGNTVAYSDIGDNSPAGEYSFFRLYEDSFKSQSAYLTGWSTSLSSFGTNEDEWNYFIITCNDSHVYFWVDNVLKETISTASCDLTSADDMLFGRNPFDVVYAQMQIDEWFMSTEMYDSEDVNNVWDGGNIKLPCGGTINYFILTAKDLYDSETINNITATINGTIYSTTNGAITTTILTSSSAEINIEVSSNELGGYFNKTYSDYNVSSNLEAEIFQSEVDLLAYEIVTNDLLTGTFKINGTLATTNNNYLKAGTYNLTFNKTGYYDKSNIIIVTPLFNGSDNVSDVYDTLLNVTLNNAYTLNRVQNFTGWVYDIDNSFNTTFNTTSYETSEPLLKNRDYIVFVNSNDYSITDNNYKNDSWNDTFYNITFSLYTNNSILITLYDEATGFQITTTNITIILTGNASEDTYYTTTGTKFLEGLQDGNYTIKLTGGAYQLKTYVITVAERSTQSLNAYLSTNYSQSIFTILNEYSGASIESSSFNMARLINASWVTVESKLSDITGRAQVNYLEGVKYRFTVSKTGYITKVFELDPVLFSSYNVKLTPIQVVDITSDYSGIGLTYYPKYFYNDEQNSLTFTINDPSGSLTSYYVNITYPNGTWVSKQSSGVNAVGETFNIDFNISDAGIYDRVTIKYGYDTSITSLKEFSYTYSIIGGGSDGHTLSDIKDNDYGMGIFEKILIATITVLLISGVAFLVAGITGSLILGLLSYGFFVYIQFLPLWSILISLFVGMILLINKSR